MSKLEKDQGFLLRSVKYGETSYILDLFTKKGGLQTYIIHSVRKSGSKISPSSVQLMSHLDLDYYFSEKADIFRIKELKPINLWINTSLDIRRIAIGLFLCELCRKSLTKFEPNTLIYELIQHTFTELDEGKNVWNIHIWFILRLADLLGFGMDEVADEPYIRMADLKNFSTNTYTSEKHLFSEHQKECLILFMKAPIDQCHFISLSHTERSDMIQGLLDYLRLHNPHFEPIKSLAVLRDVFDQ